MTRGQGISIGATLVLAGLLAALAWAAPDDTPEYGSFVKECVENRSMALAECDELYEAPRLTDGGGS